MTTIETFATLYYAASDAVKQRLADVAFGMRIAQENNNGPVSDDHKGDPPISAMAEAYNQKQEG